MVVVVVVVVVVSSSTATAVSLGGIVLRTQCSPKQSVGIEMINVKRVLLFDTLSPRHTGQIERDRKSNLQQTAACHHMQQILPMRDDSCPLEGVRLYNRNSAHRASRLFLLQKCEAIGTWHGNTNEVDIFSILCNLTRSCVTFKKMWEVRIFVTLLLLG